MQRQSCCQVSLVELKRLAQCDEQLSAIVASEAAVVSMFVTLRLLVFASAESVWQLHQLFRVRASSPPHC